MSAPQYASYIKSRAWRQRRAEYYATYPRLCAACKSTERVHLHHRTYDRMGAEWDADLMPLCEACHTKVHQHHQRIGGRLDKATDVIVAGIQRRRRRPEPKGARRRRARTPKRKTMRQIIAERRPPGRSDPVNEALADIRQRRRR